MASGFFAILDDIGAMMDDVAINAKLATQKTAGILGDDLAVNAEKSSGFISSREIPVLWEITKGSFLNKIIIVPVILLLNVLLPAAIIIILIIGGFYLAYEGVEKIIEYICHTKKPVKQPELTESKVGPTEEKIKIKSAITTDFILSIEIIIIALSTVINSSLTIQILTLSVVSIIATVGVYGIVALVVRMDDLGFMLIVKSNRQGFFNTIGQLLVKTLPIVIKVFSVVGTLALLLVSGGIFSHNIEYLHYVLPEWPSILKEFALGLVAGIIIFVLIGGIKNMIKLVKTKNANSV